MKLLYTEYLWALLAIAIPIIIHLFNFRKFQKVYFSNVNLLKEVKLETQSKSKLKHLIILTLRILAITAIVLAFCQPYIPTNDKEEVTGDNAISIYIDNSHSMNSKGVNGYRLELAKEQAEALVNGFGPTDQFQILTNDFEGRHQRLYSKGEAIQLINEIEPSFNSKHISEVYERQRDLISSSESNKKIYWLSDFQESSTDISDLKLDSNISVNALPYSNQNSNNIYIDSIWFETPVRQSGSEDLVFAKIVNETDQLMQFRLSLVVNGENRSFTNYEIDEDESITAEIPYLIKSNGIQHCELVIEEYPNADLTFDDHFYFSYSVAPSINVLHLYEGSFLDDSSGYFGAIFGNDPLFQFKNAQLSSFDFSTLKSYQLVILSEVENITSGLNAELTSFMNNGGSVCLFPADKINLEGYNSFLQNFASVNYDPKIVSQSKVSNMLKEHPIYDGVFDIVPENIDLPVVQQYYPIYVSASSGGASLLTLQNGKSFAVTFTEANWRLTCFATSLKEENSNLSKHALFVPTLLRLAEFSNNTSDYFDIVGEETPIDYPQILSPTDNVKIADLENKNPFIPEIKSNNAAVTLLPHNQIKTAGHYNIEVNGTVTFGRAYNYNREESKMLFYDAESLKIQLDESGLSNQIKILTGADGSEVLLLDDLIQGKKYWWHLIVAALIFLGLEILVFRLFP